MTVTAKPAGPAEADAAVIEQSWAKPERFAAIFERYRYRGGAGPGLPAQAALPVHLGSGGRE